MWGQKFGFVVGSSLSFLFKHFAKIKGLFLHAFLIVGSIVGLIVILFGLSDPEGLRMAIMSSDGFNPQQAASPTSPMIGFLVFIAIIVTMLAVIPYVVGIIRSVVLDEEPDPSILTAIFTSRSMGFLWVYIKMILLLWALFIPVVLIAILSFGSAVFIAGSVDAISPTSGGGIFVLLFATILVTIGFAMFLLVRWMMAFVNAALDKGTSLKESKRLTKGSWWLIALSYIVVGFVVNISFLVLFFVGSMIVGPIMFLGGPLLGTILGAILYVFLLLLSMVPTSATLGYLYLILTDQVKFDVPVVKKQEIA